MIGASSFTCINCEREIDRRWWNSRDRNRCLPPFCFYCERRLNEGIRNPKHGSIKDRRNVMRLSAMCEALRSAAVVKQWSAKYARA